MFKPGQALIKENFGRACGQGGNRFMYSSKHGTLFKSAYETGLNRAGLEIANLREQCAWVHSDRAGATEKALSLLKAKLKRLENIEPLEDIK